MMFSSVTNIQLANDTTSQALFAVRNNYNSTVRMKIRRATMQNDSFVLSSQQNPLVKLCRLAARNITGGIPLNKNPFDTNNTSNANVEILASVDDGRHGKIQATFSNTVWQQFIPRARTVVEQMQGVDNNMLPLIVENQNFTLKPGEGIYVQAFINAVTGNNSGMNNYWLQIAWEEEVSPTHEISGITKDNSGTALGSCDVYINKFIDDKFYYVGKTVSDSVTGAYSYSLYDNESNYVVTARKTGSPNVFDVTDFNITPTVI